MKLHVIKKNLSAVMIAAALMATTVSGCANSPAETVPAQEEETAAADKTTAEAEQPEVTEDEKSETTDEEASEETEAAATEASAESEEDADAEESTEETDENEADAEETEEETKDDVPVATGDKYEMRDISPKDLVAEMTTGWNLGNTFDSHGTKGVGAETSWGNPKTTKEMIDALHDKGFDLIRIPTTWMDHMGEAPDYTVDPEWFSRVEEVINYALDDGMYVILNTHHEEDWRIPDDAHIDEVDEKHAALWNQIAEYFKDYGDHLIFEGLNEPRIKGDAHEWDGGTDEVRKCLNRLNKTFVDTVRATGGNNEKRLLLITSVAASPLPVTINDVELPEDDHIGVSIHAYTPYAFTFDIDDDWELNTWDGTHKKDILDVFNDLKKTFLSKDIPVIITEYGAIHKNDNVTHVTRWVSDYLSIAKANGIPCIWWDNGQYESGNEHFAIFDRKNLGWYRESVADAIMDVYK